MVTATSYYNDGTAIYPTYSGSTTGHCDTSTIYYVSSPEIWGNWIVTSGTSSAQENITIDGSNIYYSGTVYSTPIVDKEYERKWKRKDRLVKNANFRAERLLKDLLTEAEWEYYKEHKTVKLETEKYCYDLTVHDRIWRYDKERKVKNHLCVESKEDVPKVDTLISWMFLIQNEEQYFNEVANVLS